MNTETRLSETGHVKNSENSDEKFRTWTWNTVYYNKPAALIFLFMLNKKN